jgi:filamentous hemagglutinin family protein
MNSSLNHVYRIVWNAALGLWQVASEATRGRGKTGSSQQARKARRALAAATAMTLASPAAWAVLPTGGNVVAGSASITQAGNALNINQASDKAAINWQSFSIGQGNSVNFVQPSATSVALNRVLGNDVSVIQGAINANGQVFLVNQNGVLFTPTAQVNVGGIVASTQNISTADFMAGKYEFSGNSTASVENQGSITAANGGVVALVAAKVINSGTITAPQGTVGLAVGNTVLLDLGGPIKIQVTEGALNAAIEQSGGIRADGGTIYLTAKAAGNLAASVINHSGVTRALTMSSLTGEPQGQTGSIVLSADQINHTGTLDVSGLLAGQHGGDILAQGKHYTDSGTTLADGAAQGGNIDVRATHITQTQVAKVSASSSDGQGGRIEMIGDLGNGRAEFAGQILATGRRRGGFVDTSGAKLLIKDTLRVNTTSSEGQTGEWLLDPVDFTIAASGGDITGAALSAALQSNNVTIQTLDSSVTCSVNNCGTGNTSGKGDIHVNDSITATNSGKTLTLQASRDINVNKAVKVDGLNLTAVGNVNVNDVVDVGSSLTVNYGASVSGSTFTPNTGVRLSDTSSLNMKMTLDGFIGKINLGSLANSAVINGNNYIIIRDRAGLLTISNNTASLANRYVIANDIDLGSSWTPIGISSQGFTGFFEGLGHLAKNLNVTTPLNNFSGFFNAITNSASISNLGVVGDVSVSSGAAGGLVGTTGSAVDILLRNVYSKVNVSTTNNAGGLLGTATNGTTIINAISVGQTIKSSTASAGGVVGSFSTFSGTRAKNVFSSANVEGAINAGGLFGGLLNNSASGSVNILNVYATGNVVNVGNSANVRAGGLIGQANSNGASSTIIIDNAFASGKVTANATNASRGGLIGFIGTATGANMSISNAYWDSAKSEQGAVSGSTVGLTTTNVNDVRIGNPATLFPNLNSDTWAVVNGTPTLKVFQSAPSIQQVFIRLACGTLCFNTYGNELPTFVFDDFAAANGTTPLTNATLTGTATFNVTDANNNAVTGFNSLSNAGTYKFVYTGGLMASGFELVAGDAVTWTVVPRTLTATLQGTTANPLSKAYDGNANLALSGANFVLGNFAHNQGTGATLGGSLTGSFNNANVAQANTVTANLSEASLNLTGGALASNYVFPTTPVTAAGTITPKALTVITNEFVSSATATPTVVSQAGCVSVTCVGSITLDGKNLGLAFVETEQAGNYRTNLVIPGASNADLTVLRDLTLAGGYDLTLRSDKNLFINSVLDATTGTGSKVTIEYGQGAVAASNTAQYILKLTNDGFTGKVNLKAGQNFSTKLGSDGMLTNFTVVTALGEQGSRTRTDLQGITGDRSGRYVLGADIDASATAIWNNGAGFEPIDGGVAGGATPRPFQGIFDGLGHTVNNLQINSASSVVGLFAFTRSAELRHVGLEGGQVVSRSNDGVGALVGEASSNSLIRHVYAKTAVTGFSAGGLVGRLLGGQISNAFSTGKVVGSAVGGGLVGEQSGSSSSSISESYATGAVESTGIGGGLVGSVRSIITLSDVFATGAVEGTSNVGGLVGNSTRATINRAYATGKVTGTTNVGGFIGMAGETGTTVTASFWDTETSGLTNAVGTGSIGTGATGKTTTQINSPLTYIDAGWDFANVWGKTLASANTGGIQLRDFSQNFYDNIIGISDASKTYGEANTSITGATLSGVGVANVKLDFGSAIGQLTDAGDYAYSSPNVVNVTNLVAGQNTFVDYSVGKLTINKKALTVALQGSTANPLTKVYNGNDTLALASGNFTLSGFVGEQGVGAVLNGVTSGAFNNANVLQANTVSANVGEGTLALAQGVKASNYSLPTAPVTAAGSITAKAVQVSGLTAQNKEYDGKRAAMITGTATVATDAFIENDEVSVSGSISGALFADQNAGNDIAVSVTGLSLTGKDASNYQVTTAGLKANITPKALSISGPTVLDKTYDGNRTASVTAGTLSGLVTVDGVTERLGATTAAGQFASNDVARDAMGNVIVQDVAITYTLANGAAQGELPGAQASNYTLAGETKTAKITPKTLTVTNTTVANKTYDGTTAATVTVGTVSGLVEGERLGTTTATGSFADKDVAREADGKVISKNVSVAYTLVDGTTTTTPPTTVQIPNLCPVGPCTPLTITTTIPGTTIQGAKAGNYSLASETKTAKITPKALTISGSKVTDKQYDGTQAATVTAGMLSGLITVNGVTETLGATTAVGEFVGKNASSEAQAVNTVYTLVDGANPTHKAGNYSLANDVLMGKITQRVLTITGSTVTGRDYDGTKAATVVVGTLGNLVGDETLGATTASGTFADKDAGSNKNVTVAYTLADGEGSFTTGAPIPGTGGAQSGPPVIVPGALASNYTLANETLKGSIAQKAVTVTGIVAEGKTYDGNTTAKLTNQGTVATGIEGETLTVATTGSFNDKNAGDRKVNTTTTIATNGTTLASNYTLNNASNSVDATITQKAVSVAGIAAKGKTYDGNTTAELTNQGTVATGIDGETLTVATTGSFNDKNAGDRKVNTLTTIANNGTTLASNYSLSNSKGSVNATIAQKAVSVVGIVANGKTYDGNTTATLSNQGTVATGISGESLAVSTTGSFNDKNAGARKVNTTTTIASSGETLASNYTLSNATNAVDATIAQKAVTVTGIVAEGKTYDGNLTAKLTNQGTVATGIDGETLTVATTGSFDKKNAGARKVNTLTTIANNDTTLASNYMLSNASNSVDATIAQKALTIAATATDKVYDGKSTATATLSTKDVLGKDEVTLNQEAANFINANQENDKNVGQNKTVRVTGLSLTGGDAANYLLTNGEESADTTANLTAKSLTIAATASDKVYNASTTAEVTLSTSDKVEGDVLTLNKTAANFDTKNVGTGKTVTVEGLSLGGADAGNYAISNTNAKATDTADISKAALSVSGITAANKTYDGTANATVSTAKAQLKGLFEGDKLSVSANGSFADKTAATGKTVTLSSSYSGADVDNYTITDQATTTADISKLGGVKVIADKQSKTVGAADPKLTFTVTGLLNRDVLVGSLAREPGEAAGLYDITQGSLANENYEIAEFTPAQLTISQPIADVAIANAQTLEPKLDLQIEREALEERSGDIAPFIIAANQPRAGGPAQLIVVNGGIRLPAGQQEEN